MNYPKPLLTRNDRKAKWLIIAFSVVIFGVVSALGRLPRLQVDLGFDIHLFAAANAVINSIVTVLLVLAFYFVKVKNFSAHRNVLLAAMMLSVLFLISYIAHHLLAGEARFGDVNHDGLVSVAEKSAVGMKRLVYFVILSTHILLASIILPFILFTAYRGLSGDYQRHKKLARYTWPVWLYVSATGPIVYLMISPYYS
ncbi:MAG: DUF420 domain-containing protein [Bacteroidetes bacterium]|nr:DUF420 domain-containing protein [Bacteroidota bacterium]